MVTFTPKGLILPDPPTILYENFYQDPTFRTDVWIPAGATGVESRPSVGGPNGNGYFEVDFTTSNSSSPMAIRTNDAGVDAIPVEPGVDYTFSAWWYINALFGTQRIDVAYWDAAGGALASAPLGSALALVAGEFTRLSRTVLASEMPVGAAYMRVSWVWSGVPYPDTTVLRMADAQVNEGLVAQPFTLFPVTDDDGDFVQVAHLNANLDRASQVGVGGMPVLSSERPNFGSIDDEEGTLIYETDSESLLYRRAGNSAGAVGVGSIGANWRNVVPGVWRDWVSNNIWSGWLTGDNNVRKARYMPLGRLCFVHIEAIIGAGGDITNGPGFASSALVGVLPLHLDSVSEAGFTADDLGTGPWPIGDAVATVGGSRRTGRVVLNGNSVTVRTIDTTSGGTGTAWSSTVPANWAVGDSLSMDFCYYTS